MRCTNIFVVCFLISKKGKIMEDRIIRKTTGCKECDTYLYIPTIAIVAFLIFFICKVRRILSLFFILFNVLIIYISIRNIIRVLYG